MNTPNDPDKLDISPNLEALVGRRARKRIVHPTDGRVLVQRGCIITRSAIQQFADTRDP